MLNIQNYTKRFGDKIAVDDLSLHIAAGEICAFIRTQRRGQNDYAKSLLRLIKAGRRHHYGERHRYSKRPHRLQKDHGLHTR